MIYDELEELRRKQKNGTLTDAERKRLEELEEDEMRKMREELAKLRERQRLGLLTEAELRRL